MSLDYANVSKADILIVDDSPDNLRVLSSTLIEQGYEVRCVKSASMALIGIQTSPPDLILLDIRMPYMDGYEVCQQLKAHPKTQSIPIIFLSALDEALDKVRAFEVGGADYITKPFQTSEVLARVKHQLTIQKLQKQLIEKNQHLQQEIDERKQIEEALRQEIYQHTLTEAALEDAKEIAEAANYAKSEFLSRISHELRTPLNAILGFAHLLDSDESLSADNRDYAATIGRSGLHLLKLINDILALTHSETSKLSLNDRVFDLSSLLETLAASWKPRLHSQNLQLVIERGAEIPQYIRTDESKLRQILGSLLDNARKFTSQGVITVRVAVVADPSPILGDRPESPASQYLQPIFLLFAVEDTGTGIPSDKTAHLFEAFSQTEVDHQSEQGLGLGLPICRQFARLMGGDISVESRLGRGTTMKCYIQVYPAIAADLTAIAPSSEANETANFPSAFGGDFSVDLITDLSAETLQAAMPAEWIAALYQAAIRGFDQPILSLLQEIPASHAPLAKTLTYWTRNFQFEQILKLTQPIAE